jgi:hypothetical protein
MAAQTDPFATSETDSGWRQANDRASLGRSIAYNPDSDTTLPRQAIVSGGERYRGELLVMSSIYGDQHRPLKDLLTMAGETGDATLLIPDLQRPYVWVPSQVIVLVDSLIRGWPFGTLLTWKVRPDDPARELVHGLKRKGQVTG